MFHSSRFPDLIRMALHSVCDARHRSPYAREHHCLTAVRANRHEKQQPEIQQQQKIYRIQEYKWPLIIRSSAAIQAILEIAFSSSTPLRRLTITRTELPSVEEQSKKKISHEELLEILIPTIFSLLLRLLFCLSLSRSRCCPIARSSHSFASHRFCVIVVAAAGRHSRAFCSIPKLINNCINLCSLIHMICAATSVGRLDSRSQLPPTHTHTHTE